MLSHQEKQKRIVSGVRTLFDFHFTAKDYNLRRGHILGKTLFDGDLFGSDAGKAVGMECARTVTRHIFSPFALLKAIDSSAQLLLH